MACYEVAIRIRSHVAQCISQCALYFCAVHSLFPGNNVGDSVVVEVKFTKNVVLQHQSLK